MISDHQSLVMSSQCKNSRRIQRWLLGLAEYNFDIKYRRGLLHSTPDALSRVWSIDTDESATEPVGSVFVFRDVEGLEEDQEEELADAPLPEELVDDPGIVLANRKEKCPELGPIVRLLANELTGTFPERTNAKRLIDKHGLTLRTVQ